MPLKSVLNILLRRWYVIALCFVVTVVSAFVVLKYIPSRFEGRATVVIDPGQMDPATGEPNGNNGSRAAITNLIAMANSQKLSEEVFENLGYNNDPALAAQFRRSKAFGRLSFQEWGANLVSTGLVAQPTFDGSNILVFIYKSGNSVSAAATANAYANAFVSMVLDMRRSSAQQAAQWLDPQIDRLKTNLAEAQNGLADFRKSARVLPVNVIQDSDASLLNSITSQLSQTKGDALKLETLLAAKDVNNAALAEIASSPLLDSLRAQLITTKTDLARVEADVGSHNAKVVSLNAIKQAVQQQIEAEMSQIRRRLSDRLTNYRQQIIFLQQQLAMQTSIVINQQSKVDQMNNLAHAVETNQEQLSVALKTAATSKLQSQASYSNVSLLDAATPPETPSFPKRIPIFAASLVGGLILGIAFALIAEMFDRRIRTIDDLMFALDLRNTSVMSAAYS